MKKEDINDLTSNEKQKIIKQYLSMCKDLNTISELTGIKYHTVVYHAKQLASVSADNADRHWCEICQYRAKVKGCDYYLRTNKLRGCDPAECDKCVPGEPLWKINDT